MSSSATFETRPASVSVFGILHIVFGVIGLLGLGFSLAMYAVAGSRENAFDPPWADHPIWKAWTIGGIVIGVLATVALISAGVGLLRMRPWARTVSIIYATYSILMALVGSVMNFFTLRSSEQFNSLGPTESTVMMFIMVGSGVLGMIYPIAIWYFLTRPAIVAAFDAVAPAQTGVHWSRATVDHDIAAAAVSLNPFAAPQVATTVAPLNAPASASENVAHALIPTRNGAALTAYYLGLFSIIPVLGLPLGIVAIVLGVKGLRRFREDASVRGRNHAWVGIICATLFGGFNLLLVSACVVGMIAGLATR